MNEFFDALLLVFMKYPQAGKVKTRLAERVGIEQAAAVYRQWIGKVLSEMQPARAAGVRVVAFATGGTEQAFDDWKDRFDELWMQPEGDLGTRLAMAFQAGHQRARKVLAIGTDCLSLSSSQVLRAVDRLDCHEVVLGPAKDGGYYLVGSSVHIEGLFAGIRWSSQETLGDQLSVCQSLGCKVALLEELRDIDTYEDFIATGQGNGQ